MGGDDAPQLDLTGQQRFEPRPSPLVAPLDLQPGSDFFVTQGVIGPFEGIAQRRIKPPHRRTPTHFALPRPGAALAPMPRFGLTRLGVMSGGLVLRFAAVTWRHGGIPFEAMEVRMGQRIKPLVGKLKGNGVDGWIFWGGKAGCCRPDLAALFRPTTSIVSNPTPTHRNKSFKTKVLTYGTPLAAPPHLLTGGQH